MHFIEPENRRQASLFSSLDDFISSESPVRLLDEIVDEIVKANPDQFLRRGLRNVGRRAYSPQILLKLYLYGYLNGISSSRKLEAETKRNMELMWLLGRLSPDHKTISDYRKNHSEAIHFLTLRFREYLLDHQYIPGRKVALDGTKLKANAVVGKFLSSSLLEKRILAAENQLDSYLAQLKRNDVLEDAQDEDDGNGNVNQELVNKICELEEEIADLRKDQQRLESSPFKKVHLTDPECRNMRSRQGFIPAYNLQMVTDMELGMIAHAEVRTEVGDHGLTEEVIDNLEQETDIVPEELFADKAYYSTQQLHWLEIDRGIKSWIPAPERTSYKKDRAAGIRFEYQTEIDAYRCSEGEILHRKQVHRLKQAVQYQGKNCQKCRIKEQCTSAKNRIFQVPFLQPWIDQYKKRMQSAQGKEAMKKRKAWAEHPFGTIKLWMGKIPIKLRGKRKVQTEVDLYTTAYNFKRLIGVENQVQILKQIKAYNWIAT